MKQIRETLRLRFEQGVTSSRSIAKAIGAGKSAVSNYLREASRLGVTSFAQVASLSEAELAQLFSPTKIDRGKGLISTEESIRRLRAVILPMASKTECFENRVRGR